MSADNIKVSIRFRPLIAREQGNKCITNWSCQDEKEVIQVNPAGGSIGAAYVFDRVFDERETTQDLYDEICEPIVNGAMQGFHGTIFAYGQTSSGKTFTMCGSRFQSGIISLAMDQIFQWVEETPDREFLLRCSFLEIYNEKLADLLASSGEKTLKLHEDQDHNVCVGNLQEEYVKSTDEVITLMDKGNTRRHIGETAMNEHSSRSHAIFRMVVESRQRQAGENEAVMVAHLNFVDLAGSEKASENSGDRLKEGCAINKSLFHLSHVISKLSEGVGHAHINYRDSKLTRILQNALGGNSKTAIICTVTPASVAETHSTLRFASSAKVITNKPKVNEVVSDAAQMKRYRKEIEQLKKVISGMSEMDVQLEKEDLQKRLEEKEACQEQQESLINKLKQMICVSSLPNPSNPVPKKKHRRETWCIGKLKRQRSSLASHSATFGTPGSARKRFFSGLPSTPSNLGHASIPESPEDEVDFLSSSQVVFEEPPDSSKARLSTRRVAFNIFPDLNSHMDKEVQTDGESVNTETRNQDVQTTECSSVETTVETGTQMITPPDNQVESGDLEQIVQISEQLLLDKGALEAQRSALEAKLVTKQTEIDAMTRSNMTVTDQLTSLMVTHQHLERDYSELVEHTRLEREYSMNNSTSTEDLGTIMKLRQELISLQRSSSDAQAVTMEISKQLSLERDSNKSLQEQLCDVEKQLEQIKKEKSDFDFLLEMERSKRQSSEAELRQEIQTLYAKDCGSSLVESDGSNMMSSSLSTSLLESKDTEITSLKESVTFVESERDCLREALQETANQETEIYHKQLKDAAANVEHLQAQIAMHMEQHSREMEASQAGLEAVKENHAADITKLQADVTSIQEHHAAESAEITEELHANKQLHAVEITQLTAKLESEAAHMLSVLESKVVDLSQLNADLENSKTNLDHEIESLRKELEVVRERHTAEFAELTEHLSIPTSDSVGLQAELNQKSEEFETIKQSHLLEIEKLTKELEVMRDCHREEMQQVSDHSNSVSSLSAAELEEVMDKLMCKTEEIAKLQSEFESSKEQHVLEIEELQGVINITDLHGLAGQPQSLHDELKSDLRHDSPDVIELQEAVECKSAEISELHSQIDTLKEEHLAEIEKLSNKLEYVQNEIDCAKFKEHFDSCHSCGGEINSGYVSKHDLDMIQQKLEQLQDEMSNQKDLMAAMVKERDELQMENMKVKSTLSLQSDIDDKNSSRRYSDELLSNQFGADQSLLDRSVASIAESTTTLITRGIAESVARITDMEGEISRLHNELKTSREVEEMLDESLHEKHIEIKTLTKQCCSLEEEVKRQKSIIDTFNTEAKENIDRNMDEEISSLHQDENSSRDVEEMLDESCHEKHIEIAKLKEHCCSLEVKVKRQKSIIDAFSTETKQNMDSESDCVSNAELSNIHSEIARLEHLINEKDENIAAVKEQLQTSEAALKELTVSLQSVTMERNKVVSENESLEERLDHFVAEDMSLRRLVDQKIVEMEKEKDQHMNERELLKEENMQLVQTVESVKDENVRVSSEKQSLQDGNNKLMSETALLREECESLRDEINTLATNKSLIDSTKSEQAEVDQLRKHFEDHLNAISSEKTDVEERYAEKCATFSSLVEQHKELVEALEEEKQVLSDDLARHKDQVAHLEEVRMAVKCSKEENEELVGTNGEKVCHLENTFASEHERKVSELQRAIGDLEEERTVLLSKINDKEEVSTELGELRTSVMSLKQENQELINTKTSEVTYLQAAIESLQTEKSALQMSLEQQTNLQKEYQLAAETLKNTTPLKEAEHRNEIIELQQEVGVLREKIRAAESDDESESLKSHIEYLEKMNEKLHNCHEEDQEQHTLQFEKLQKKCDEIEELRHELLQKGEAMLEYMEKDDEAQNKIQELMEAAFHDQTQIEQLNLKLEDSQESLAAISAEKESLKGKAITLAEEYNICKTKYCSSMDEVEVLKCKLDEIEQSLEEYKKKHSLVSTEIEILRQNSNDAGAEEVANIQEQVEIRENRITELELKVDVLNDQINTLVKDNDSLSKYREEDKLFQENELSSKIIEFQTRYESLRDEHKKCKEQIASYENDRVELEGKLTLMKRHNQTSLEELEDMDAQRRKDITELTQQKSLERELDMQKWDQQEVDFQEEIASLREKLEKKDVEIAASRQSQEDSKLMMSTGECVKVNESGRDGSTAEVMEMKATIDALKASLQQKKIDYLQELCNKDEAEARCKKLKLYMQISNENTQELTAQVKEQEEASERVHAELTEEKRRVEALKLEIAKFEKQHNTPVVHSTGSLGSHDPENQKLRESLEEKNQQIYNHELKLQRSQQRVTKLEEHISFQETKLGRMKTEMRRLQEQSHDVTIFHPAQSGKSAAASIPHADKEVQVCMDSHSNTTSTPATAASDGVANTNPGRSGIIDSFSVIVLQHKIDKLERENQRLRRSYRSTCNIDRQSTPSSATSSAYEHTTTANHSLSSASKKSDIEQRHTITPSQPVIPQLQGDQTPRGNAKDIVTSTKTTLTEMTIADTKTPLTDSSVFKAPANESAVLSDRRTPRTGVRVTRLKTELGLEDDVKATPPVMKRPLVDIMSNVTQASKIQNCGKPLSSTSTAFHTSQTTHSLPTSSSSKSVTDLKEVKEYASAEAGNSRVMTRTRSGAGISNDQTNKLLGVSLAEQKLANARKSRQGTIKESNKEQCKQQ